LCCDVKIFKHFFFLVPPHHKKHPTPGGGGASPSYKNNANCKGHESPQYLDAVVREGGNQPPNLGCSAYFPIFKNRVGLWDHVAVCVCMCLSVYPPIVARHRLGKNPLNVARQRLGRNVTAITNTHAAIEEFLNASFSMWPVSYQGK
jgi:hypothetical protein